MPLRVPASGQHAVTSTHTASAKASHRVSTGRNFTRFLHPRKEEKYFLKKYTAFHCGIELFHPPNSDMATWPYNLLKPMISEQTCGVFSSTFLPTGRDQQHSKLLSLCHFASLREDDVNQNTCSPKTETFCKRETKTFLFEATEILMFGTAEKCPYPDSRKVKLNYFLFNLLIFRIRSCVLRIFIIANKLLFPLPLFCFYCSFPFFF